MVAVDEFEKSLNVGNDQLQTVLRLKNDHDFCVGCHGSVGLEGYDGTEICHDGSTVYQLLQDAIDCQCCFFAVGISMLNIWYDQGGCCCNCCCGERGC